jgi:hypothetical protein
MAGARRALWPIYITAGIIARPSRRWRLIHADRQDFADRISVGAEYLYNRYDDDKYFVAVGPGTAPATNPFLLNGGGMNMRPSRTNFDFHTVRATVNFHF